MLSPGGAMCYYLHDFTGLDCHRHALPERTPLKYSIPVAYALWAISGCGALGLHRFYLGKTGSGFVWLCTGGLAGIGCIYDLFTLPRQVEEANLRYEAMLIAQSGGSAQRYVGPGDYGRRAPDTPEKTILRLARSNKGQVTPGEVAIEGDLSVDEARKELDKLAKQGMAELRIRSSGVVVYFFPEFAESGSSDFVDL